MSKPVRVEPGVKLRDADKMALIPVKFMPDHDEAPLPKPDWMRIRLPATSEKIQAVKNIMRKNKLHSVCEEASCPNLSECFNHGTATFMILGAICTRRCPFCDVAHGRPLAPDAEEPRKLARTIAEMGLKYVVITSVDRDGTQQGYDISLIQSVASAVGVPVVACGGAGKVEDFGAAVHEGGASAVAAGSLFVFYGKRRAVLINFPSDEELRPLLA